MDLTVILQSLLDKLWFLVSLLLLVTVLKSARFKGWVGEAIVNLSAHFLLDRKTYHLIRNVTLPTEDGTTQIDHLIVSPYGVFMVETKNIRGWIFGGERQRYWTQKIYRYTQNFVASELQAPKNHPKPVRTERRSGLFVGGLCRRQHFQDADAGQRDARARVYSVHQIPNQCGTHHGAGENPG